MEPVTVDGVEIPASAIAAEMQYHPASDREAAWQDAATALVLRQLLLREAARLAIAAEPDGEGAPEEATIRALIRREVATPQPDDATLRRYWTANRARFRAPDVYEAAHILFAAAPEDEAARARAKAAASEALAVLGDAPERFAALAAERSDCPSRSAGGRLGQQSRGDLVAEIETFVFALEEGQICPVPVASRYGFHVLRLDRRVIGGDLPFESARPRVEAVLASQCWQRAVSQYLRILAGRSEIGGIDLPAAATPLVQ